MSNARGDKRDALIAAGKAGHKILIFGQKVFGSNSANSLSHENAVIETIKFPEEFSTLTRLVNYSVVILDYAAFDADGHDTHRQDIFEKQMEEALGAGTTFCFVHYNNKALEIAYNKYTNFSDNAFTKLLGKSQIGYRWLEHYKISPHLFKDRILSGNVKRNVFKVFLDKWGASRNYFGLNDNNSFNDVISALTEDIALGFTLNAFKGRLIYLPFQRNYSRPQDILEGLKTLVDCLLTYITESLIEVPEWASKPFFSEEDSIRKVCSELEQKLKTA